MAEHIAPAVYYLEVHLLYASIVCCAAWILTSVPRGSATLKYWIWVAAALNFIVPVGGLIDRFGATRISWAKPLGLLGDAGVAISQSHVAGGILIIWLAGAVLMSIRLCWRIRAERRVAREMPPGKRSERFLAHGVPVSFAPQGQAPSVAGVLRPHISLPEGIERLLSGPELEAVLVHEATHARRRDNLILLLYEVGLCALWFHPLVWIAGSRLALYRELSCDESVMERARGGELVSALAKLAHPEGPLLLRASASSFLSRRVTLLMSEDTAKPSPATNVVVSAIFAAVLLSGVYSTVAHTACCFVVKAQASSRPG